MKQPSPKASALDVVRRRPLRPDELAQLRGMLAAAPESREAWEEEQQLSLLLGQLQPSPVPADFSRRVLLALDRETEPQSNWLAWWFWGRWEGRGLASWVPGLALAAALVFGLPALWLLRDEDASRQLAASAVRIAQPVHEVGRTVQLPAVEILRDFEAIDRMRQLSALADEELLASLEYAGP